MINEWANCYLEDSAMLYSTLKVKEGVSKPSMVYLSVRVSGYHEHKHVSCCHKITTFFHD